MTREEAEAEMLEGYRDGLKDQRRRFPRSLSNRGSSYRHGWLNGRDDRMQRAGLPAARKRHLAEYAIRKDMAR